ncbi:hypothetical protein ACFU8T_06390 [Sphingobacterium spiritivorum]|uniref:Uncharacterized protein n=1 Tax=Sphingobacterium spiritivorum ATCC 33861 TaxID=525373 RepID=D7VRH2_SPHSI|nr:hypothetical protein [Sphingobacterium spiritivorum]EFK56373.1 hypothetical protein HMPREF0766_13576 [Sphingobacterium spiritivorum ATCC 33861]QQT35546.1 hypothetical protein I6J01_20100 [Sphingobacterium spiritivorum]WQD32243.1 hypothetical protein U0038_12055 [Sphingobacterium spiritivorum]SUJ07016.1 Uncharacterised protein [Sphingobacterium spiritivorum]
MMNKNNKTDYISPAITSNIIELEQGIAASSARLVPGGDGTNSANPKVEDWTTDTESRDLTF